MSYIKEELFGLVCDNCNEAYIEHHNGWSYMIDERSIWELADNDGWHEENDKHYCPSCHHFDDDDNLIIHEAKTSI